MTQNSTAPLVRTTDTIPVRRLDTNLRSPWDDLAEMHRQMDEFFSRAFGFTPLSRLIPSEAMEMPDIDITEKGDNIIVKAVVPGFTPADIKIDATAESVRLDGERKAQAQDDNVRQHQRSRWTSFTHFQVTIPLPAEIDPGKVNAELAHGVLTLELPKSEQARQKSIRVNVKAR